MLVGHATLYGAVAGGVPGVQKAINLLREEIDLVMAQIACPTVPELNESFLLQTESGAARIC